MDIWNAYDIMFTEYPEVVTVSMLHRMLGGKSKNKKATYILLQKNKIEHIRIGREYRIPKINVIKYMLSQ